MDINDISKYITQINDAKDKLVGLSLTYLKINERNQDAYDYVRKNNIGTWGDNIWHIILDDAIKLRSEINKLKENK